MKLSCLAIEKSKSLLTLYKFFFFPDQTCLVMSHAGLTFDNPTTVESLLCRHFVTRIDCDRL